MNDVRFYVVTQAIVLAVLLIGTIIIGSWLLMALAVVGLLGLAFSYASAKR